MKGGEVKMCFSVVLGAWISVPKFSIVSATHNNSASDTFSWLARILMASEDVTVPEETVSVGKENF